MIVVVDVAQPAGERDQAVDEVLARPAPVRRGRAPRVISSSVGVAASRSSNFATVSGGPGAAENMSRQRFVHRSRAVRVADPRRGTLGRSDETVGDGGSPPRSAVHGTEPAAVGGGRDVLPGRPVANAAALPIPARYDGVLLPRPTSGEPQTAGHAPYNVGSEARMATKSVRRAALGGVIGPVVFVGSWSGLGAITDGYSPLHDPISDLAGRPRVDPGRDDRGLRRVLGRHGVLRAGAALASCPGRRGSRPPRPAPPPWAWPRSRSTTRRPSTPCTACSRASATPRSPPPRC